MNEWTVALIDQRYFSSMLKRNYRIVTAIYEPWHEISNNLVFASKQRLRSACTYAQADQSLFWSLKFSITVKLLTEPHLRFLCLKGGCTGSSEFTLVKIPHFWKSHVMAYM